MRKNTYFWSEKEIRGTMITFPNAKINIGLYVVGKREDGYHNLETAFFPISLHDVLEIKLLKNSDKPYEILLAGTKIEGNREDNLIYKVYEMMKNEFSLPPLSFYLYKKIPTGAGLGGGSSDAAYTMKTINEMFSLGLTSEEMEQRIAPLGADCAFFIKNTPVFAQGIGNEFSPLNINLKDYYLLLIKPEESVPTRDAYKSITPKKAPVELQKELLRPLEEWRGNIKNDFENSVFPIHPRISAIKQTLYDMGALYASMSGSGSSVFGIFKTPQENAKNVFDDCFVYEQKITNLQPTISL